MIPSFVKLTHWLIVPCHSSWFSLATPWCFVVVPALWKLQVLGSSQRLTAWNLGICTFGRKTQGVLVQAVCLFAGGWTAICEASSDRNQQPLLCRVIPYRPEEDCSSEMRISLRPHPSLHTKARALDRHGKRGWSSSQEQRWQRVLCGQDCGWLVGIICDSGTSGSERPSQKGHDRLPQNSLQTSKITCSKYNM